MLKKAKPAHSLGGGVAGLYHLAPRGCAGPSRL